MDELSSKILQYRAKHNISQEEFAKRCKVTKQTIWEIESGKRKHVTALTETKIKNVLKED